MEWKGGTLRLESAEVPDGAGEAVQTTAAPAADRSRLTPAVRPGGGRQPPRAIGPAVSDPPPGN